MIASNIHGKNHHKFGGMVNSVLELKIYDGKKSYHALEIRTQIYFMQLLADWV